MRSLFAVLLTTVPFGCTATRPNGPVEAIDLIQVPPGELLVERMFQERDDHGTGCDGLVNGAIAKARAAGRNGGKVAAVQWFDGNRWVSEPSCNVHWYGSEALVRLMVKPRSKSPEELEAERLLHRTPDQITSDRVDHYLKDFPKEKEYGPVAKEHKIMIGMPEILVKIAWGDWESVNETVTSGGVHHQLVYGLGNYVYTVNGRVTSWQANRK